MFRLSFTRHSVAVRSARQAPWCGWDLKGLHEYVSEQKWVVVCKSTGIGDVRYSHLGEPGGAGRREETREAAALDNTKVWCLFSLTEPYKYLQHIIIICSEEQALKCLHGRPVTAY